MAFAFEKLLVYHKAVDFADAVCDLTLPTSPHHTTDFRCSAPVNA